MAIMIDPSHPALRLWYGVVLLASAFTVAYAPFIIVLGNFWASGQVVILDVVFLAALWVNLHTRFLRADGQVCASSADYRRSVLFTDDLICAVPLEAVRAALTGCLHDAFTLGRHYRATIPQLCMILAVFRALAFNDCLDHLHRLGTIGPLFTKHVKLSALMILLIVWMGTAIAVVWSVTSDAVNLEVFIDALYWSASTIIPVGYGNISVRRPYVLVIASLGMFAAFVLFLYVILQLADDEFRLSRVGGALSSGMGVVIDCIKSRDLPADLRASILSFFYVRHPALRSRSFRACELIRDLPVELRREVGLHIIGRLLHPHPTAGVAVDPDLVAQLTNDFAPRAFLPGTILLRPESSEPVLLGIVVRGVVEATNLVTGLSCLLTAGACFPAYPSDALADTVFRTLTFAELHLIRFSDCIASLRRCPNLHRDLNERLLHRLPLMACQPAYVASVAVHDPRFASFKARTDRDHLVLILGVAERLPRDSLESVLLMVEALVRRRQIRDGVVLAVRDLLVKPDPD